MSSLSRAVSRAYRKGARRYRAELRNARRPVIVRPVYDDDGYVRHEAPTDKVMQRFPIRRIPEKVPQ